MWLVNTRTNHRVLLAKYYPSTGWYAYGTQSEALASIDGALNAAFDEAGVSDSYEEVCDGGRDWVLCYEGDALLNRSLAADAINHTAAKP